MKPGGRGFNLPTISRTFPGFTFFMRDATSVQNERDRLQHSVKLPRVPTYAHSAPTLCMMLEANRVRSSSGAGLASQECLEGATPPSTLCWSGTAAIGRGLSFSVVFWGRPAFVVPVDQRPAIDLHLTRPCGRSRTSPLRRLRDIYESVSPRPFPSLG